MLVPCPSMDEIAQWMESIEELDGGCKWPAVASVGTSTDTIDKVVVVIVPLFSGRASLFDIVLLLLILIVLAAQCLLPEV